MTDAGGVSSSVSVSMSAPTMSPTGHALSCPQADRLAIERLRVGQLIDALVDA